MKYFDLMPTMANGDYTVRNIFNKFVLTVPLEDKYLYTHTLLEHETLESVAFDEYADAELFWVLVIINDIRDMIFDLPLPDYVLQTIAKAMTISARGHLDLAFYATTYDSLQAENDDKRKIKVLQADFLNEFLSDVLKNKPE
jgi:hypothetical protein